MIHKGIKYIGYFLTLVGIIILTSSILNSINIFSIISDGKLVKGQVTNERLVINNRAEHYVYSVSFVSNGLTYTIKTKNNSSSKKYAIGESVQLYFDITNPYNAVIDNVSEKSNGQIIMYTLSFIFIIFGVAFVFKSTAIHEVIKGFESDNY